jgi:hypothetical protein
MNLIELNYSNCVNVIIITVTGFLGFFHRLEHSVSGTGPFRPSPEDGNQWAKPRSPKDQHY